MSRRFWGGVMAVTILLIVGSAYVILNRVANAPEPQPVPLRGVKEPLPAAERVVASSVTAPAPAPEAAAMTATSTFTAVATAEAEKPAQVQVAKPVPGTVAKSKRNILFKLTRPAAKEVAIIGDFNEWTRQPLKKTAKGWEISVALLPGRYEYAFVIDGKRARDPNNKQATANGKSSILTVKPLAKNP